MFSRKKKTSDNPEVREAMEARDALMDEVRGAVEKVDRLQDELLDEYRAANGVAGKSKRERLR